MKRPLYENICSQLSRFRKMVFIAGPRQAGKTTFVQMIAKKYSNSLYFNWDILDHKQKMVSAPQFYENVQRNDASTPLIVFDELHKYPSWKNYLKSIYDRDKDNFNFLVSGSGRLDIYQKGGDSLAGRYLLFHLWPFTLAELAGNAIAFDKMTAQPFAIYQCKNDTQQIWKRLAKYGGFPDPYLNEDIQFYQIWSNTYKRQLLREDIRDFAAFRNMEKVELLFSLLPSKIGSPLSIASLAGDIQVSFDSVKAWLDLFENFFLIFRISPWTVKINRTITKEKKLYLFDYAGIESDAAKFENMVALELFRAVTNWNDRGLGQFSLQYIRNREKEEVDFLIADNRRPFILIEAKLSENHSIKSIYKFQKILGIPAAVLVNQPGICKVVSNADMKIMTISADHWLSLLP